MNRENSLLAKVDPYKQALEAMNKVEGFGVLSDVATDVLSNLSDAFRKGVADAVMRMHKCYYGNRKMSAHLFQVMKDVYGEDGWF